jgi:cystathionine gamma-synthase
MILPLLEADNKIYQVKQNYLGREEVTTKINHQTLLAQGGKKLDKLNNSDGITHSINPSTTFYRQPLADKMAYADALLYSRDENPDYIATEQLVTALELADDAYVFSSGMASFMCLLKAAPAGSHIIAPQVSFFTTTVVLREHASDWGYEVDFYDNTKPDHEAEIAQLVKQNTYQIWIETPANPTWNITDIEKVAAIAHSVDALCIVDNTVATPILTKPITLGADIVWHSASKYLNGHHDVIAGVAVTADAKSDYWQRVRRFRRVHGCVLGPFENFLLLRGMQTLDLRVRKHCQNAMIVAQHFKDHQAIEHVAYAGLTSFLDYHKAVKQMDTTIGFGGMMSIFFTGGKQKTYQIAAKLQLCISAVSLGGNATLFDHRATIEGDYATIADNALRFSIGIENPDDIIADIERAII